MKFPPREFKFKVYDSPPHGVDIVWDSKTLPRQPGDYHAIEFAAYQAALDEIEEVRQAGKVLLEGTLKMVEGAQAQRDEALQTLKYRNETITELRATIAKERERAERAEAKLKAKEINSTLRGYDGMAEELERAKAENKNLWRGIVEMRHKGAVASYCDLVQKSELEAERVRSQKLVEALKKYANPETHSMDASGFIWSGDYFDYETAQKALAEFEGEKC